jgi:hypothetical protein
MYRTAPEGQAAGSPARSWPIALHLKLALLAGAAAAVVCPHDARAAESRAEIQINLCSAPAQVIGALQLAEKGKSTTVWLFDSPVLTLYQAGLRLRLREKGEGSDLTLKVAGQDCGTVDSALLRPDGKCEADLHGDALDDVVSLTRRLDAQARGPLLAADARNGAPLVEALKATLDPRQRTMLAARRGISGAALLPEDIARLGPSTVRTYRSANQAYEVEVWTLPGGVQFVELSYKVPREAALARRADLLSQVTAAGLSICPDQESQARAKLAILAR